jgi:hypothetical protein
MKTFVLIRKNIDHQTYEIDILEIRSFFLSKNRSLPEDLIFESGEK